MEGSTFRDIQFIQKREGQIKLNINSNEAFLCEEGKIIELKELTIVLPDRNFKVLAQKGLYHLETGDFSLMENIEGFAKNFKILATEANWDSKSKVLSSEKPIIIEGKKITIHGNSGKANESFIELKQGVKAIVYSTK
jgi:hypothetical protein